VLNDGKKNSNGISERLRLVNVTLKHYIWKRTSLYEIDFGVEIYTKKGIRYTQKGRERGGRTSHRR